ncbi:putative ATP-dependent protease (CrgA) [Diplocarpon rosae]|nr:putative ATP-dependent protease (CrgA) [Diplocarpon rosae]
MSPIPLDPARAIRSTSRRCKTGTKSDFAHHEGALEAAVDARQLVRLLQCPQCSYPLQEPVTLPCGNSLCKNCLPERRLRPNISYPATPNRLHGFTCPFAVCGRDHAAGDCSVDVVLNKVMSMVRTELDTYTGAVRASEIRHRGDPAGWSIADLSAHPEGGEAGGGVVPGGRPERSHTTRTSPTPPAPPTSTEQTEGWETEALEQWKESVRAELDCQVCYGLFLEPFTTTCGHTFCRACLDRVLDHSNLCPLCRRRQALPPGRRADRAPANLLISQLISGLCPEALVARAEAAEAAEKPGTEELDTPLFICTLSFPQVPTFLHIFEPRYRLMIRRAIEQGDGKFGMLMYNSSPEPQGELGVVNFYEYGTLLHIESMHLMPDGRSLIETVGVSRFRVLKHGNLDGYTIGKIERIDDMSIEAEEALEARETAAAAPDYLSALPTRVLFEHGVAFVKRMREQSAPWLHARVFDAYGECPDDPAIFPWWLASVLPTADAEKYHLLVTDSVRQRLKICAGWIADLEAGSGNQSSGCNVL